MRWRAELGWSEVVERNLTEVSNTKREQSGSQELWGRMREFLESPRVSLHIVGAKMIQAGHGER